METTGLDAANNEIVCAVTKKNKHVIRWAEPDRPAKSFTPELTTKLAEYLSEDGNTVVTFNGLGFDLRFLSEKVPDAALSKKVASTAIYAHVDIMYCFFTENGYRTSLASLLSESALEKTMTGEEASHRVSPNFKSKKPHFFASLCCFTDSVFFCALIFLPPKIFVAVGT